MRRSRRVNPVSAKRRAAQAEREEIRLQVFARDRRCLLAAMRGSHPGVPSCIAPMLTPHHLRKAGQGGDYSVENLVALCAGHNDWLETLEGARFGESAGLVIRRGTTHVQAWALMRGAGLVNYGPDGT